LRFTAAPVTFEELKKSLGKIQTLSE
jgi:hypothetical protein